MSDTLNLIDVLPALLPAQDKWYYIGLALGLEKYTLTSIDNKDSQKALQEMLSKVLDMIPLTYGKLIDVLRDPTVSKKKLANDLALIHDPSKYQESDSEQIDQLHQAKSKTGKRKAIDQPAGPLKKSTEDCSSSYSENKFVYEMNHRVALIINNVNFPDRKNQRDGSDQDTESLESTLKMLGFRVHVEEDLTKEAIIPEIVKRAKKKNCDGFICCILTHGDRGLLTGSDGEKVKIEEIAEKLSEVQQLRGKPKMFFFQACQGKKIKKSMTVLDSAESKAKLDMEVPKLPPDSDYFYGFASSYGTPAMRDPDEGSLYINALCQVLEENYEKEDLLTMVTKVHYLVSGENRDVGTQANPTEYQQQPQLVSTLRKIVRFDK